jgi:mycothiol synthase
MQTQPLTWTDIPRVHQLLARRWAVDDPRAQQHIGDFYWALRVMPGNDPLAGTRVWVRADGSLAAFAWLDPPEFGDAIVNPISEPSMLDQALDWLESEFRAQGRESISVVVVDGDQPRAEALAPRGYTPGDGGNTRLRRAIETAPGAATLPTGYSLGHVSTAIDMERRGFVEADAFPVDGRVVTADAWRALTQRLPTYRPELDLIAVAPDGTGASACTCWYDEATRCGEFEAVGTAQAHLRKGVGRAVITEGLRRLHTLGATAAVVFTQNTNDAAIALYQSCGFEVVGEDRAWTKSLAP